MTDPHDTSSPAAETAAPPPKRRLSRATMAVILLVVLAIVAFAVWSLGTRTGPDDFFLEEKSVSAREALIERMEVNAADAEGRDADVARLVAGIQRQILRDGKLPKSIWELDVPEGLRQEGYRVVGSRAQWRVYGPDNEVLARGN